jgi:hypothetical protein
MLRRLTAHHQLGFRATVDNFQPYYTFSQTREHELRVGAAILEEAMGVEVEKMQRLASSKAREKQGAHEALLKVQTALARALRHHLTSSLPR